MESANCRGISGQKFLCCLLLPKLAKTFLTRVPAQCSVAAMLLGSLYTRDKALSEAPLLSVRARVRLSYILPSRVSTKATVSSPRDTHCSSATH